MRFFRLLEQFDAGLTRSYEVWGHWFWRILWILVVPPPVVYVLWVILWIGFTEITVDIQNNTDVDRPLVKVNVIDSSGKDLQSMGACCYWDKQRLVEVNWVFGVYRYQRVQEVKEEIRHKTVLLPERKLGAVYLHVLLLPNDEVKIWWGPENNFSQLSWNSSSRSSKKHWWSSRHYWGGSIWKHTRWRRNSLF